MRIVFMGTPKFAVNVLQGLIDAKNDVCLVVSQPDKEVGRKKEMVNTPVKDCALKHNIEVFQPIKIKKDYQAILDKNPDIIITCAYGQIIPTILLETPKYKAINVHASLLPKLRGGAPIHKAIIDGYEKTGITIMHMTKKMDAGDILFQEEIEIDMQDTVLSLHDKLSNLGSKLLLESLPKIEKGEIKPIKQDEREATFAYNISRSDEYISFNNTSLALYNQIRGLNPWPVGYATINNTNVKIYASCMDNQEYNDYMIGQIISLDKAIKVKTKDGAIDLLEIKVEGKKKMSAKDFLNGQKIIQIKDYFII